MPSRKPRVVVPRSSPLALREIPLVGRVEDLRLLKKAADSARRGEGNVVVLQGEAGIGKTRLAAELEVYVRSQDMQVLRGRCPTLFRMDGVHPYGLWKEVIRDYLDVCTPEQLYRVIGFYPAEVTKLVPELAQKLRVVPKSMPISPEHTRDRLYEGVSQFITNISREAPLLVILDDLQWADESSLLLLHYLALGVYEEALLLLGAYRDTYIDETHALSPVLTELNRERLLQSVSLDRLSFPEASEMIKRILKQEDVPKEFCTRVFAKTQGNPFFIEEVIKSLKEEDVICRKQNTWKIGKGSRIAFPATVKSVFKTRIKRLDDKSQKVLRMASLIGKDFTFEALRGVTGTQENELLETVEKLLTSGLIKETVLRGKDVYSFADKITRDVVYEEISHSRRRRLHAVVGNALEKSYAAEADEHLGELAVHFREAGDKDKALDYFLKAGEKAAKVYASSEAASYFQSALELLEEKDGQLQEIARILEQLGDTKRLIGEYDTCLTHWNKALSLWKRLHKTEQAARLHRKMANILWGILGDVEEAMKHEDEALKALKPEPANIELANLYADRARLLWYTGDMMNALSWGENALTLAKKLNAHDVIAESYANLALVFNSTGNTAKAHEYLERALRIALDNGYLEIAVRTYNNIASTLQAEENDRILECLEKGLELAKQVGIVHWISWIGANLAWMYTGMGQLDKARLLAEESVALDRKTGSTLNLAASLRALGAINWALGEWTRSEQCYKEALSISQRLNNVQQIGQSYERLGWFYLQKGDFKKARKCYGEMQSIFDKAGAEYQQVSGSVGAIWTYIELGETENATSQLESLEKFAHQAKDKDLIAWTDALRAMLLRAQGQWNASIEHFEKSCEGWEATNARRWNAYRLARVGFCEHACVYVERNQEGDVERACGLLSQALELYRTIGAKREIEEIQLRMRELETRQGLIAEPQPAVSEVALPSHITTGYHDLDQLLLGGIPRTYAVILTSPSCDERDLLVTRFLEEGARESQVTFHIVAKASGTQSLVEQFPSSFYLFVCNPQADKIIRSQPNVFKLKGVENLTDLNIALTSAFRRLHKSSVGSRRICIEIVSDVLLQHHTVHSRRWLNALIPELKSKGFTTLAVLDPEMHPPQEVHAILDLFDGEISIYETRSKKGAKRALKIKRMFNQKYRDRELRLEREKLQNRNQ